MAKRRCQGLVISSAGRPDEIQEATFSKDCRILATVSGQTASSKFGT